MLVGFETHAKTEGGIIQVFLSACPDVGRRGRSRGEVLKAVSSQTSKNRVKFLVEFTRRNVIINDRILVCNSFTIEE